MKKRHLAVAIVAVLAVSSSTIASAEGGSHRRMGGYEHIDSVAAIALSNSGGTLTIDTSGTTPSFAFNTSAVTPHIDFNMSTATTHFDTSVTPTNFDDEPGISDDGVGQDDFLPAGTSTSTSTPPNPATPPAGLLTTPAVPEDSNEAATPLVTANPAIPPVGLTTPATPVDPNTPATPAAPSWITKPHAKSNDDNPDHSDQSSEDSQD